MNTNSLLNIQLNKGNISKQLNVLIFKKNEIAGHTMYHFLWNDSNDNYLRESDGEYHLNIGGKYLPSSVEIKVNKL